MKNAKMNHERHKLILASASQARQAMLKQAGLAFEICPSSVDEGKIKAKYKQNHLSLEQAGQCAMELAVAKANSIAKDNRAAWIIGSDQILLFAGKIYDKAQNHDGLYQKLACLSGQSHHLISAFVLINDQKIIAQDFDVAMLTMRPISDVFLKDYIKKHGDEVINCVGGYQIEGVGAQLFNDIKGDYFTILGLPLLKLLTQLRNHQLISS